MESRQEGARSVWPEGAAAPSIEALKEKILRRELTFPGVFEHIMRMLLHHPDIVAFGTAKSVAASCDVSNSTFLRLVRYCGYENFPEMRVAFRCYMRRIAKRSTG